MSVSPYSPPINQTVPSPAPIQDVVQAPQTLHLNINFLNFSSPTDTPKLPAVSIINNTATLSAPIPKHSPTLTPVNSQKLPPPLTPRPASASPRMNPPEARKTELCFQNCVRKMENSADLFFKERDACCGVFCGDLFRCGWGMIGIIPKTTCGVVSLIDSIFCSLCALATSPFCCCADSCCGQYSSACCTLSCDSIRISGIASAALCSEIFCGVPNFCCVTVCQSQICNRVQKKCCRAAGNVLLSGISSKVKYSKVEHLSETLVREFRDSIPMQMVREGSGSHLFREKVLRSHQRTRSEMALPAMTVEQQLPLENH